jgi:hypothetical protein
MSARTTRPVGYRRREPPPIPPPTETIHSVDDLPPLPQISRSMLMPEEEALSLPKAVTEPGAEEVITRHLGPGLTVDNPAWIGDPVPLMRALQKKFVEHALRLEQDQRAECLRGIELVEAAVQMRLRLQQMRMNEFEMSLRDERAGA